MMCKKLFLLIYLLLFSLLVVQDASASPVSEALNILDSSDQSLNNLEAITANFNKTISDLLMIKNSMQTTIALQQRQLDLASENSKQREQQWEMKSKNYESTIRSLEESYNLLLTQNIEQGTKITKLQSANKCLLWWAIVASLLFAGFVTLQYVLKK